MLLKRKRSDSEISCASSLLSSPPGPSNSMEIDSFQLQQNMIATPSLFSGRTRKRHRDNCPSEEDVHQHTLSLLFTAQQTPQYPFQATPFPFSSTAPVANLPATHSTARQSSLHSFFAIPSAPRQTSPSSIFSNSLSTTPLTSSANQQFFEVTNCEDCDASLNPDSGDVNLMDIDTGGASGHACTNCGKNVCHSCAVSNLGADRRCLMCAGGKKHVWVGGLGWMNVD